MSFKATLSRYGVPACAALFFGAIATTASAQAGGRPLVLDTQTGIHSGAEGTLLQSGSLNQPGMVPARPLNTLPEVPSQGQQTIVVLPYVDVQPGGYSGAQGYSVSPGAGAQASDGGLGRGQGLRSSGSHARGLYGSSTGAQPSVQPEPRSRKPHAAGVASAPQLLGSPRSSTTSQQPLQPRIQPTSIAPMPAGTDSATISKTTATKSKTSTRPSDPHTATGSVMSAE